MATPNYGYEKRQRELAKKQKKEEKLRAKASRKHDDPEPGHADSAESPAGGPDAPTSADGSSD